MKTSDTRNPLLIVQNIRETLERRLIHSTYDPLFPVLTELERSLTAQMLRESVLLEALKRVMAGFDAGVWVRSTKDDDSPDWAMKIIGHVQALGAAAAAIAQSVEGR